MSLDIQIFEGSGTGRWNTILIPTPDKPSRDRFCKATGIDMTFSQSGQSYMVKVCLELDTVLEAKDHGEMTICEFWDSKYDHIRTQTLERDSASWNGYLGRHKDGNPFAYDNGAGIKYVLTDNAKYEKLIRKIESYEKDKQLPRKTLFSVISLFSQAHLFDADNELLLKHLRKHGLTDLSLASLKSQLKADKERLGALQDDATPAHGDIATHYADRLISEVYGLGRLGYSGGVFWQYTGTYWRHIDGTEVEAQALKLLESDPPEGRSAFATLTKNITTLVGLKVLENLTIDLTKKRKSIINCINGEVWLTDEGPVLKAHDPGSGLTSCSSIGYDQNAQCPMYEKAALGIFKAEGEHAPDMVRHIEEILGYGIQSDRFLKVWVLGHGEGSNAKTSLFELVQSIVGPEAYAPVQWHREAHKNPFINAQMVGKLFAVDDDYDPGSPLADGPLKMMSEEKLMSAEEKYEKRFQYWSTVLPVILCNELPKSRDITRGLKIRVQAIPFRRNFLKPSECGENHPDREDPTLFSYIEEHELAGVLNKLIDGYYRVKKRRDFKMPVPCRVLTDRFLGSINHLSAFVADRLIRVSDANVVQSTELYDEYVKWCTDNGIGSESQYSQMAFSPKLEEMGFRKTRKSNGIFFHGLELRPIDDFDDIDPDVGAGEFYGPEEGFDENDFRSIL